MDGNLKSSPISKHQDCAVFTEVSRHRFWMLSNYRGHGLPMRDHHVHEGFVLYCEGVVGLGSVVKEEDGRSVVSKVTISQDHGDPRQKEIGVV